MYNRNITVVLCLILFLGLFFQYNRSDGFVRLIKNTNAASSMGLVKERADSGRIVSQDRFLLVYDPTSAHSVLLRGNIQKTLQYLKKDVTIVSASKAVAQVANYSGVILALDDLDRVKSMEIFREYVRQGGKVYLTASVWTGTVFNDMYRELGFSSIQGTVNTPGVKMLSNLLIGGKGFEADGSALMNSAIKGELDPEARLHMTSLEGVPLLWEYDCGQGTYIVYNGSDLHFKGSRGILTGMLGLGRDVYVYPVAGIKLVCLDDFPAPIPQGHNDKISAEYHLSIPQFFRQVWWPDMLQAAAKYDVKYTGLIVESYNNRVKPPFTPEDTSSPDKVNLIIFGRELLKSGGELGIHGYNHQSLAPKGYVKQELGYIPWESKDDMIKSLAEVKRYVEEVYPEYKLKSYVPPSNILSPIGRQAVIQSLPDLKVIASVYIPGDETTVDSYVQEFEKGGDGILEMPRVSVDYSRRQDANWEILNIISFIGVFSHFVHPDDVYAEFNSGKSWQEMYEGFESLLKEIRDKHGWLRSATLSQGAEYLTDYLNTDYRLAAEGNNLTISCWGFRDNAYFILRTPKKIKDAQGCQVEVIDENVYLLKISATEVNLRFESEVKH